MWSGWAQPTWATVLSEGGVSRDFIYWGGNGPAPRIP